MNRRGYSLVELLVAAAILAVAILSIIAVVRKGREIDTTDKHRRQARSIVTSVMERKYSSDRDYNMPVFDPKDTSYSQVLDPRGGNPITANVREVVAAETLITVHGMTVPAKPVTVKVRWSEVDGIADSLVITRWVSNARGAM